METDPQDLQLKRQFAALSEADRQSLPSFDDLIRNEPQAFRDRKEGRESWLFPGYTALALTAVTLVTLLLFPLFHGGRSTSKTVEPSPLLELEYPSFSWDSTPSAFLLSGSFSEPSTSIDSSSYSNWEVPTDALFDYSPDPIEDL